MPPAMTCSSIADAVPAPRLGGRHAWAIWAAAVAVYLVAVFHRTSLSVAGLAAVGRFHIGAAELATFTVLQLLVYAAMQVPVGVLLDRYGSRRLLATGLVLMTASQLGFAFVTSYPAALAMRVIVGMGDAMTFLSVMRLVALWFPPARNPLLAQLTSLTGQLGAVLSAVPMAHALARFGWTATYVGGALTGLIAGVVMWLVVVDSPAPRGARAVAERPPLVARIRRVAASIGTAWANPDTRLGAWAYFMGLFAPTAMLLLWGYPYLVDGLGIDPALAATLLTLLTVTTMVASPVVGILIGRAPHIRIPFLFVLTGLEVLSWTLVLVWPGRVPMALLVGLMMTLGSGFSAAMIAFDFVRASVPAERMGTALGLINVAGYVSSILVVLGIGLVLDLLTPAGTARSAPSAFHVAMLVPYLAWSLGALQVARHARRAARRAALA